MSSAEAIVQKMLAGDAFSQWLGIEVEENQPGYARLSMRLRPEMTNGFQIAHGAISYALADSALAFASNGYGKQALSIETSISHLQALKVGERMVAEAKELHASRSLARYEVWVRKEDGAPVAHFKGSVFRTDKDW